MKAGSFPLALRTALIAILVPVSGHAADLGGYYRHHHRTGLEAKIHFCSECHGKDFHGYQGYYAIPSLRASKCSTSKASSTRLRTMCATTLSPRDLCGGTFRLYRKMCFRS